MLEINHTYIKIYTYFRIVFESQVQFASLTPLEVISRLEALFLPTQGPYGYNRYCMLLRISNLEIDRRAAL